MVVSMRKLIRSVLTWLLVGLFLAIVVAVVGEWFIEVAKAKGLYTDAGNQWDSVMTRAISTGGSIAAFLLSGWVLFPATGLLGLVAGLWLDTFLKVRESAASSATPDSGQRLRMVVTDLDLSIEPLRRIKKALERSGGGLDADDIHRDAMAFRGSLRSLETLGFEVPWIAYEVDPIGFIEISIKFVDRVLPLLARGHIDDAKAESAKQTAESKQYMAARARL